MKLFENVTSRSPPRTRNVAIFATRRSTETSGSAVVCVAGSKDEGALVYLQLTETRSAKYH